MKRERDRDLLVLAGGLSASLAVVLVAAWLAPLLGGDEAMAFERDLLRATQQAAWPGLAFVLREVSQLSEGVVLLVLSSTLGVVLWSRFPRYASALVLSYWGSLAIHWLGKVVVGRPRPRLTDWPDHLASGTSYPSGHAAEAAAVYVILPWILVRVEPRLLAIPVWIVAALLVVASGVARLHLGLHWPSDVLVGWLAGLMWAGACIAYAAAGDSGARDAAGNEIRATS